MNNVIYENNNWLKDGYIAWVKDNTFLENMHNGVSRISLPFLNHNNAYTEIYIEQNTKDSFLLSDDGETINELELCGIETKSKKKHEILHSIIIAHGAYLGHSSEICIDAGKENLFLRKHMLLQCISKIQDLFFLKSNNVRSLFTEEVALFFDQNEIRYTPNAAFIGKSTLPSYFDFVIPKSKTAPERLIRAVNQLNNDKAKLLIFSWEDTRSARKDESILYTIYNDEEKKLSHDATSGFNQYGIKSIAWSQIDQSLPNLVA